MYIHDNTGLLGMAGILYEMLLMSFQDHMKCSFVVFNVCFLFGLNKMFLYQVVEFISVLLTIGSESAEKELVQQGAIKRVIDLFFE